MAFGKDPEVLKQTGSFRQRANSLTQQKNEQRGSGGGGAGLYFVDEYKPSVGEPDMIRIIEGHYLIEVIAGEGDKAQVQKVEMPFFQYTEHFDGRHNKSCICSAGPWANNKAKRAACYGCDVYWDTRPEKGPDGKRPKPRMSRSDKYVWTVIDYGRYHHVEETDRDGQLRLDNNQKPFMRWEKCIGVGCTPCRTGKDTKFGHARRWNTGWSHYNTILTADISIGKSCRTCGGQNTINGLAWLCGNSASCGEALVDLSTTNLKQADIDQLVARPMSCRCGYNGLPMEYFECRQCTPVGGTARRATIFDVDMNVQRVQSQGEGNGTTLLISQWSPPRAIDENFKQYAKPLDLEKIYKPSTLENQATQFQVKGPPQTPETAGPAQGRQPMNQQTRPYAEAGTLPPAIGAPMGMPAGASPYAQPYAPPNPYGQQQQPQPQPQMAPQYAPPFAPQMQPQYAPPSMPQQQMAPPGYPPPQAPPQYAQPAYAPPQMAPQQPAAPAYQPPPGFGGMMPPPKQ